MDRAYCWIDGTQAAVDDAPLIRVVNPATEEHRADVPVAPPEQVAEAVASARRALTAPSWADLSPLDRGRLMVKWGALIAENRERLAELLSIEHGRPLALAGGEIDVTAQYFEYYGGYADKLDGRVVPVEPALRTSVVYEPRGVVAHILPWNYPADIFARGVAPCLAAGNTVVVKPAPQTTFIALELARLGAEAGIPGGVVNVVVGDGETTGAALASHPDVDAIAFCGSIRGGKAVLRAAAENLTPVVSLELGGKAASILLPDVDVGAAAGSHCWGFCYNTAQSCGAQSRLLVPTDREQEAIDALKAGFANVGVGAFDDEGAFMGPLISEAQLKHVLSFVEIGIREGATLECGGKRMDRRGWFMEPTLFSGVEPGMTLAEEEVFGPVLSLMTYQDVEDAVRIANSTKYGLSADLRTNDIKLAHRVSRTLDVSYVSINGGGNFGLETPFGGVKQSGFGREGGLEGLRQYARVKSIVVRVE